jgi:His-Xaa-Ser system radical SAM maturase HxsC
MDTRFLVIELQLRAKFADNGDPFVVKVTAQSSEALFSKKDLAFIEKSDGLTHNLKFNDRHFSLQTRADDSINGDVLLCFPKRGVAQRLFHRASKHNTILFTEQCDQLCVMCSQPPKNIDYSWLFSFYEKALMLLDPDTMIGISGGEPTLYKNELLGIIERVGIARPDISYHILSNGQHFSIDDSERLSALHDKAEIVWGIPLYSHIQETHDEIVGKVGAFNKVMENLLFLGSTNARIELRTVITAINFLDIPHLANFIAKNVPFVTDWAIMAMEPIGYAKANKDRLFIDHTAHPKPLVSAIEICDLRDLPCNLYNVPRCTMPETWRDRCADSIADWKKKYLPECDNCSEKHLCTGFFEWYNESWQWSGVRPIYNQEVIK